MTASRWTARVALTAALGIAVGACGSREDAAAIPGPEDEGALVAQGAETYGYSCARCHNARAAAERTDRQWEAIIDHMRVRANLTGGEARAVTAFMRALNVTPVERVVYDTLVVLDTVVVMDTVVRLDSVFVVSERTPGAPRADTTRVAPPPTRQAAPPPAPKPAPPAEPSRPVQADLRVRGRALVASKGCAGCHVVGGSGGAVGPSLDDLSARRDADYIRHKLRDPRFDNPNTVMPAYGLSDAEVAAIAAYLNSLGG